MTAVEPSEATTSPQHGPLFGIKVLALAGSGPTPFASMLLADMGADVVRVARPANHAPRALPQTDAIAPEHDATLRGVDSVTLDLKSPSGRAVALELARDADVFIEGYRPGVTERLGLGPDILLASRPSLVYARLTGYGQTGPLAQQAGHDINYLAQSGVLHALGRPGDVPRPPINLLGDYAGGGTFAAFGITCAIIEAQKSGVGQVIDAAMLDGVAMLSARLHGLRASGGLSGEPGTNYLDGGAPFYTTFRCADGRFIALGALEPEFYADFLAHLGVDTHDWPDQQDMANWPRLHELIAAVVVTRPREEWTDVFRGSDCCVSPVLDFEEAATDPHNVQRRLFDERHGALHPSPAPRFSKTPARAIAIPSGADVAIDEVLVRWRGSGDGAARAATSLTDKRRKDIA